jgi:hypothetical protein
MPQAWRLVNASFSRDPLAVRKALADLEYYMRRNHSAYIAHRKKRIVSLE